MTTVVKPKTALVVPSELRRRAGVKTGDHLHFKVSPRTIIITATSQPTYKPTKAELTAIRKGEAAIARGDSTSITDFIDEMDRSLRKTGTKTTRAGKKQ
jgi:bifunctional DNA-binding transcriptional regulator/antitoxin component of YhaV-PrlF toxin-antitoxin module